MGENLREEFRSDQSSGFFRILPISLAVTEKISNFDIDLEPGTDSSNDSFIRIHCDRFPLLSAVRAANKKKKKKKKRKALLLFHLSQFSEDVLPLPR